ncbi:MAG: iron-containing alcohol dehydrogenase [Opitutus sp.]|nr:iron-containing alcohol dehydrogenase [Opitutus sp.]
MNTVILQQPKRLIFGSGCAQRCVEEFALAGRKRLFVVTGPHVAKATAGLVDAWRSAGLVVEVCNRVNREPETALFEEVVALARAFQPDGIVGLGGGSPVDTAKLVAALYDGKQQPCDVFGLNNLSGRSLWLACIPTTAGSGAEVSPNAVLIDESLKKGVVSPFLVADVAICDPDLTVTAPPSVTASTGLDALVHCMEGYANKAAHPAVDIYALEGIRRISRSIEPAVTNGADRAARADVMLGAVYGGLCLGPVNTAAVHALSAPLGGEYRVAHGVANSLLMPHVFRFNLPAMPERYADIAVALGVKPAGTPLATAEAGLAKLTALSLACGVPQRLRDVNIPEADLPKCANAASKIQRLLKNNPREVTEADALAIFRAAY